MNREIKFRAFDKHMNFMEEPRDIFEIPSSWDFDFVELMQFTGLKDKNGKEIYEGDIVKYYNASVKSVEWYQGGFYLSGVSHNPIDENDVEVIGNIYENPELLPIPNEGENHIVDERKKV